MTSHDLLSPHQIAQLNAEKFQFKANEYLVIGLTAWRMFGDILRDGKFDDWSNVVFGAVVTVLNVINYHIQQDAIKNEESYLDFH